MGERAAPGCHTFEPFWLFDAVHHSSEHLDFVAAHREHPVDGILTQLCVNLPAFIAEASTPLYFTV